MRVLSIIVVLLIVFFSIDYLKGEKVYFEGTILDKQYKPEETKVNTGIATNAQGNSSVVVTSDHEKEKWILIVKDKKGEIVTVEAENKIYYNHKIGDTLKAFKYIGYKSNLVYYCKASK